MPSECCYFVDKAAAADAAPALYYFGSILHCFAVFTQNLGQTHIFLSITTILVFVCELVHIIQEYNSGCAFFRFAKNRSDFTNKIVRSLIPANGVCRKTAFGNKTFRH